MTLQVLPNAPQLFWFEGACRKPENERRHRSQGSNFHNFPTLPLGKNYSIIGAVR